jgi:hypothetical protein
MVPTRLTRYVPSSLGTSHSSHPSTNGLGVTGVTGVTPPSENTYLSADEGNARVQRLIDEGRSVEAALAEVLGREL